MFKFEKKIIEDIHHCDHQFAKSCSSTRTDNRLELGSSFHWWWLRCSVPPKLPSAGTVSCWSTGTLFPVRSCPVASARFLFQWANSHLKQNFNYQMSSWFILINFNLVSLINANQSVPHSAAQSISLLKRFLYLRISGVSEVRSWLVGVTFTLTWDSLLAGPAPKPNVRNERCFCWSA